MHDYFFQNAHVFSTFQDFSCFAFHDTRINRKFIDTTNTIFPVFRTVISAIPFVFKTPEKQAKLSLLATMDFVFDFLGSFGSIREFSKFFRAIWSSFFAFQDFLEYFVIYFL